jgi:hypothetical protein
MRRIHMGSIGFAALGRTIIKNNRAQRPESKRGVSLVSNHIVKTSYKEASPELIHKIKTEMQKKRRRRNVKLLYTGIIISIVMLSCLWYLKHFNYI